MARRTFLSHIEKKLNNNASLSNRNFEGFLLFLLKRISTMLTKNKVKKSIENLPESFSIDQLIEQLIFMEKIEEGIKQSEEGKVISNEDIKLMIDRWSS